MSAQKVLLVDDNLDGCQVLATLLHTMGHKAAYVTDPFQALLAARRLHPDFAFIDIGLPGIDGWQLVGHLKLEPACARTRFFALTAYNATADIARSLEAGFEGHLVKPLAPAFLVSLLGDASTG